MNKSYKVLFNRARGCMMVVNELTSSVQKSTSKKVVVALPLMFGTVLAQAATMVGTVDGQVVPPVAVETNSANRYAALALATQADQGELTFDRLQGLTVSMETQVEGSTTVDRAHGLYIGDPSLINKKITLNLGTAGLNVSSHAVRGVNRAIALRVGGGDITINGDAVLFALNEDGGQQVTAINTIKGNKLTFNGNVDAEAIGKGAGASMWSNAVQLFGSDLTFAGDKTVLTASNAGYTAQTMMVSYEGDYLNNDLKFSGKDVYLNAVSDYGVNVFGFNGGGHGITFANTGLVDITAAVQGKAIGSSNAVGFLGNSSHYS